MTKKMLVTGGTGFLGKRIIDGFRSRGYEVQSLGRQPENDIVSDLTTGVPIINARFELVVHAAGKAHVHPVSEAEKASFYSVNVQGTKHFLEGLEKSGVPQALIFISSVAVYGRESGEMINETVPLLATDPYGISKIEAERLVEDWCRRNRVTVSIFRLPLIAGPNPPGNLSAMINAIRKGRYFNIDGGNVHKSIVMAVDVSEIILKAAGIGGIYNLTDGSHPTFKELAEMIAKQLAKPAPRNIPYLLARMMALAGDIIGKKAPINSHKLKKIISPLTFDDSKAVTMLGWKPSRCLDHFRIEENK